MKALEIRQLTKSFRVGDAGQVRALDGVDLELSRGERIALIGANGSGKSTLLGAIAGSVDCDAGTIVLEGIDLGPLREHRRAEWIGRVFQNPFSGTAASMSIAENLALASRRGQSRGLSWALSRQLRAEIAERVAGLGMGLEERLDAPIGSLSGGQRQALTLLMATWRVPGLLLLDEPAAALDPLSAAKLMELTRERVERDSITTIMVTHSMQQAVNLGGRVVLMHRGRIVKQWPAGADPAALLLAFEEQRLHEESASETGGTIR